MALLTPDEVEARIRLYADLRDAMIELHELSNTVPEVCPNDLALTTDFIDEGGRMRAVFVIRRGWAALRKAMLADAQKKVDDCEAAVRRFEAGEEVQDAH